MNNIIYCVSENQPYEGGEVKAVFKSRQLAIDHANMLAEKCICRGLYFTVSETTLLDKQLEEKEYPHMKDIYEASSKAGK